MTWKFIAFWPDTSSGLRRHPSAVKDGNPAFSTMGTKKRLQKNDARNEFSPIRLTDYQNMLEACLNG